MKYADLHIHTNFSDSTFTPEEVAVAADEKGLSAIAICDHDCVDGIEPCQKEASRFGIEVVPGIELTVEKHDAEIHILGYFIGSKVEWFRSKLDDMRKDRIGRIYKMVEKLNAVGVNVNAEDVFKLAGRGAVGRLHLAQAMIKTGKVKGLREVFGKYIGFQKPCYVPHVKFTPREAIETILKTGGVPVLAHPGIMNKDEYIPELMEYGLKGIEVYHTDHKAGVVKHYEELCRQYGLLATGGSDCHGLGKGRVLIGTTRVPYELVERLKAKAEEIRNESR
ncbi:MAG: PHP domain-containing protein [Candidatus Omnitrophica bacterium]|nr:PHP domain-containing protein [Candidatus Omnitrophota bacterium]MDD5436036.1 PHP domain-containing protein [Candidatus Omnitrophota bacterium]